MIGDIGDAIKAAIPFIVGVWFVGGCVVCVVASLSMLVFWLVWVVQLILGV